jgi:hypothetical protein
MIETGFYIFNHRIVEIEGIEPFGDKSVYIVYYTPFGHFRRSVAIPACDTRIFKHIPVTSMTEAQKLYPEYFI